MTTIHLHNKSYPILNKGFIRLVDCMPRIISPEAWHLKCDSAIVQAARVSFGQGLKDKTTDTKLIQYLLRHKHTSPFEMVKFKFHVKAPIFVQRQWFRHRMSNFNEISGRYTKLEPDFYIPSFVGKQSKLNKQASDTSNMLDDKKTKQLFDQYLGTTVNQYRLYNELISQGVAKETARICLPLNMYTEFYWCVDLHNFFNFIKLRTAPGAQPEIKEYASKGFNIIKDICPISTSAYIKYVEQGVTLTKDEIDSISVIRNENIIMDLRLQNELKEKIALINN